MTSPIDSDTNPQQPQPPSIYSRKDKSLGVLCSNFLRLYNREDVEWIGLDNAANQLGVERRRIYDIVNILESVGVLTKRAKNQYNWKGFRAIPHALEELKKQAFNQNPKDFQICSYVNVSDENDSRGPSNSYNSNTDGYTKSSGSSKSESNRKEKSLGLLTQNFIKLFITSHDEFISLDTAATALLGDVHDPTAMRSNFLSYCPSRKTKVRRLYDIANVFQSMDLLEKIRHPENGKPAFRWLGVNGHPNTKSLALDTNNSKRRAFGTDITNYTDSKRYRMDSSSDWNSKGVTVAMHRNIDCVKFEHDENITMLQQPQRNPKEFVFGPFTPATAHRAGTSGNKRVTQTQDWENLADSYRPQYRNKALNDIFGHYVEAWKSWYVEADEKKEVQLVS
uniref:E2F transcription factor-like E2FF isoform X1 n=1 Tax=Tanacetum cinerariifolium TaxID=118510 RepID=A0A6L2M7W4_TANCI|nr:E2F transcription factor-like E2FF isoform X1 [Tanacetum cinerariifolium]